MSILPSMSIASNDYVSGTEVLRLSCFINTESPNLYIRIYFNGHTYAADIRCASVEGRPGYNEVVIIPGWLRIRDLITTFAGHGVWKYTLAMECSPTKGRLPIDNDDALNMTVQEINQNHSRVLFNFSRQTPHIYTIPVRPSVQLAHPF